MKKLCAALLAAGMVSLAAEEADVRTGEAAAAGARPWTALFQGSPVERFLKLIRSTPGFEVYEGLPDPIAEPDLFQTENARTDLRREGKFAFYPKPLALSAEDSAALDKLFQGENPFSPGGDEPACGKFHPDYMIVWKSDPGPCLLEIGLGCQEIRGTGPNLFLHRYIPPPVYGALNRILGKYRVSRPGGG